MQELLNELKMNANKFSCRITAYEISLRGFLSQNKIQ